MKYGAFSGGGSGKESDYGKKIQHRPDRGQHRQTACDLCPAHSHGPSVPEPLPCTILTNSNLAIDALSKNLSTK